MPNGDEHLEEEIPVELDPITGEPIVPESPEPSGGPQAPDIGGTVTEYGDDGPMLEEEAQFGPESVGETGAEAVGSGLPRATLITVAAVVVVGAIAVGVWATDSGNDSPGPSEPVAAADDGDSATADTEADRGNEESSSPTNTSAGSASLTEPLLGWEWFVISRNTNGHVDLKTKFHKYALIFLEFAGDQDLDEQHPIYKVTAARILSADPSQTDTLNCTYSGTSAFAEYDAAGFIESPKAGFVQFDVTDTDTLVYEGQLISFEAPSQIVTQTCPNGTDSRDHGRGPHSWVDTTDFSNDKSTVSLVGYDKEGWLIVDGVRSGTAGYSDLAWFIASCRGQNEPLSCDSLSVMQNEKLLEAIEGTIESRIAGESQATFLNGTGARAEAGDDS